jgi:colicin import membrane protein
MTADGFNRDLLIVTGGHALILVFVFLQAVFLPSDPIDLRQAIRVDVVGLPEKMTELPPPAAPDIKDSAPPAPEPVKELPPKPVEAPPEPKAPQVQLEKPKVKPKDLAKAQKAAMAKLKRRSALDKIKAEMAASSKKKSTTAGKAAGQVVKGNEISKGDSLTGISKIQFDEYLSSIKSKVLSNWSVPQWLMEANLKASVVVLVDERGHVVKKTISRSSGNDIFDGQALEAVEKSSPFEPPPDRIRGVLSTSGIIFNFPQ